MFQFNLKQEPKQKRQTKQSNKDQQKPNPFSLATQNQKSTSNPFVQKNTSVLPSISQTSKNSVAFETAQLQKPTEGTSSPPLKIEPKTSNHKPQQKKQSKKPEQTAAEPKLQEKVNCKENMIGFFYSIFGNQKRQKIESLLPSLGIETQIQGDNKQLQGPAEQTGQKHQYTNQDTQNNQKRSNELLNSIDEKIGLTSRKTKPIQKNAPINFQLSQIRNQLPHDQKFSRRLYQQVRSFENKQQSQIIPSIDVEITYNETWSEGRNFLKFLELNPKATIKLKDQHIKRLTLNLAFYLPNNDYQKQFEELVRTKKVFGLQGFQTIQQDHEIVKAFFTGLIEHLTLKLTTNQMALLDILKIHLKLNSDQYLQTNVLSSSKDKKMIKSRFFKQSSILDSEGKINFNSKIVQVILKQLTNIYLSENAIFPKLFKCIAQRKSILLPLTFFAQSAINTSKALEQRLKDCNRPASADRKMLRIEQLQMCVRLLLVISRQQRNSISPANVQHFIANLDNLLELCKGSTSSVLQITNILLRLDNVPGALKGIQVDHKQLDLYSKGPTILTNIGRCKVQPLRVICPTIEKAVNKYSKEIKASSEKIIQRMQGPYWKDWLQIWSIGREFLESWEIQLAGQLAIDILQVHFADFWKKFSNSQSYTGIKKLIALCYSNNFTALVLISLVKLIGVKGNSYVEQTLKHLPQICKVKSPPESILQNFFDLFLMNEQILAESFIELITRIIQLQPSIFESLNKLLRNGIYQIFSIGISTKYKNIKTSTQLFKGFNNLLLNNLKIQQFKRLIGQNDFFDCFSSIKCMTESLAYMQFLDTLTEHVRIILSIYLQTTHISGTVEKWLSGLISFLIHPVNTSISIRIVSILIEYINVSEKFHTLAFNVLSNVPFDAVFKNTLNFVKKSQDNNGILYENKIVQDFSASHSVGNILKLKHLVLSLKILLQCFILMGKYKGGILNQKNRLPIIQGIRSMFLLETISLKSQIIDSWGGHTTNFLVILMSFILMEQYKVDQIFLTTNQNISELGLKLLNAIMITASQQKVQLNKLDKLLQSEITRQTRQHAMKTNFIKYLKQIICSSNISTITCLFEVLITMTQSEKVLLNNILIKLKEDFVIVLGNVFASTGFQNLRLANLVLFFTQLCLKQKPLKGIISSVLTLDLMNKIMTGVFGNRSNMRLGGGENKKSWREFQRQMTLSMYANACCLILLLVADDHQHAKLSLQKSFFGIYSVQACKILFDYTPNYNWDLVKEHRGLWIDSHQTNKILMDATQSQDFDAILSLNLNSAAFCNWCRLYMLIINQDVSHFQAIKQKVKKSESQLSILFAYLVQAVSNSRIDFPEPIYFLVCLTIKLTKNTNLTKQLLKKTNWLTISGNSGQWFGSKGRVSVVEAICAVMGGAPEQLIQALENSVRMGVDLSVQLLSGLLKDREESESVFASAVAVKALSENYHKDFLKNFVVSAQYIMATIQNENPIDMDGVISKIKQILYSFNLDQLQAYSGTYRNQKHIYWCWTLVLLRQIFAQIRNSNQIQNLSKCVVYRIKHLLIGENKSEWDAPAIIQQVYFLISCLNSSVHSFRIIAAAEPTFVILIGQGIGKICQRDIFKCRSSYQQLLAVKEFTNTQISSTSDIQKKQTISLLQISCEMLNFDTALCYVSLLEEVLNTTSQYLARLSAKEIKLFEKSLFELHLWLVDLNGRYRDSRYAGAESTETMLKAYNQQQSKQSVSIELGYLNTLKQRYTRAGIRQTIKRTLQLLHSCMKLHLRNMIGCQDDLHKELSPAGFTQLIIANLGRVRPENLGVSISDFDQLMMDLKSMRLSSRV